MTGSELLKKFSPALLPSGKVSARWKSKWRAEGEALIGFYQVSTIAEAIFLARGNPKGACLTCGGPTNFSHKHRRYSEFCGASCGARHPSSQTKRRETNLKLHGVPIAGGFGTAAHKKALLDRYGVEHPMLSSEVKIKLAETNIERYGAENVFASERGKQRIKETTQARYGVDHVMQLEEVKEKFRGSGGEWLPAVTNLERRMSSKLKTITEQVRARLDKSGFDLVEAAPGFSYQHQHVVGCRACGAQFKAVLYSGGLPRCLTCSPLLSGTSRLQLDLERFLTERGISFESNYTKLIPPKHVDIYVPSANLAIEVNGLYHHSELNGRGPGYHLAKVEAAARKGVELIHLFEDDLLERPEVARSMILSRLGLAEKAIAARRCVVKFITTKVAAEFCGKNHLKGAARCSQAVGLLHQDELVAVGTFAKPRYAKDADLELVRFCSAINTQVTGGFSKVISFFEKSLNRSVVLLSYADRCYSSGKVYKVSGFELKCTTAPNYWYLQPNVRKRVHQTQLRKYKLPRLYPDVDLKLTERELLSERGWTRVWDCGQLVFVKRLNEHLTEKGAPT